MTISQDNQITIFSALFDLLAYARDRKKVRGISLPVAHKIMAEHGGDATVKALGEYGLEFALILPTMVRSSAKTGFFKLRSPEKLDETKGS